MRVNIISSGRRPANRLKHWSRFASLNHIIHIVADPTPVDGDHAAHAGRPTTANYSANHDDPPTLNYHWHNKIKHSATFPI